jgi:hypothetical protein
LICVAACRCHSTSAEQQARGISSIRHAESMLFHRLSSSPRLLSLPYTAAASASRSTEA